MILGSIIMAAMLSQQNDCQTIQLEPGDTRIVIPRQLALRGRSAIFDFDIAGYPGPKTSWSGMIRILAGEKPLVEFSAHVERRRSFHILLHDLKPGRYEVWVRLLDSTESDQTKSGFSSCLAIPGVRTITHWDGEL